MNNSIYPCIWCNNNAREMADFYCSVFPETKISDENPVVVMLEMFGQKLMLLNGGDIFKPNPSISLMFLTMSENEVEEIWNKLLPEGESMMCRSTLTPSARNTAGCRINTAFRGSYTRRKTKTTSSKK